MAERKKGGALKIIIIIVAVLLVLIISAGALIRFDVFGLGTQVVGPIIKDIPVVNLILPEMPEEVIEGSEGTYSFESIEEAIEILKITEKMLMESDEKAEKISEQLTQLTAEVERLKVFENNQRQFEEDKAAFDLAIATSSEALDYKVWFETMYPENAARIYGDVIQEVKISEDLQGIFSIYQNMKSDEAAAILEGMSVTKLDQVATIIKNVSSDQGAKILGAMDPTTAAKITAYLSPEE